MGMKLVQKSLMIGKEGLGEGQRSRIVNKVLVHLTTLHTRTKLAPHSPPFGPRLPHVNSFLSSNPFHLSPIILSFISPAWKSWAAGYPQHLWMVDISHPLSWDWEPFPLLHTLLSVSTHLLPCQVLHKELCECSCVHSTARWINIIIIVKGSYTSFEWVTCCFCTPANIMYACMAENKWRKWEYIYVHYVRTYNTDFMW